MQEATGLCLILLFCLRDSEHLPILISNQNGIIKKQTHNQNYFCRANEAGVTASAATDSNTRYPLIAVRVANDLAPIDRLLLSCTSCTTNTY